MRRRGSGDALGRARTAGCGVFGQRRARGGREAGGAGEAGAVGDGGGTESGAAVGRARRGQGSCWDARRAIPTAALSRGVGVARGG
jgi:hypothetical protein